MTKNRWHDQLRALKNHTSNCDTAGYEGSVVVDKVKNSPKGIGFDALKEEYVDDQVRDC